MSVAAGTTLGRYQIQSLIGAGGMGEVYLAQDTQLRRPVALKLLPANFTQDEDRLRRFEQEAYAASALNHPNILTIYEIGQVDATRFIAMEYVEGETLRQHLGRTRPAGDGQSTGSGIKLHEVLDIAIQIASALAAAQSAGIAHRDIKPENLMLRSDGYVKVLDFGLAKLTERPTTTDTEAPTRAMVNTSPGAVMGTVNYMSPEQASGQAVDSRSDIWSLGVLLYEMLTGRMPFEGPTPSHVIVAILEKDPPLLTRYITDAPEALEWMVTKALTRNRDDRYQTAREMLTDLRRLKQRLDASAEIERSIAPEAALGSPQLTASRSPAAAATLAPNHARDQRTAPVAGSTVSSAEYLVNSAGRHKLGLGIVLVLLLAAIGGLYWWLQSRHQPGAPSFHKVRLSQLTNTGKATIATISPDGKSVVHVVSDGTQSSLWVRQVATASNVQIVPPSESRYVGITFAPDGNYLYYVVYEKNQPLGTVYQIALFGGVPRKIIQDVDSPISFSGDGKRFAWVRNYPQSGESAIFIANSDGSGEQKLAARQRPMRFLAGTPVGPSWSPTSGLIACPVAGRENSFDLGTVVAINVATKEESEMTKRRWAGLRQVAWLPQGTGLILAGQELQRGPSQIWQVSYPGGQAERITNDLSNYGSVSISADGATLVTVQSQVSSNIWFSPDGKADTTLKVTSGTSEGGEGVALLPYGQIVYNVSGAGSSDLYLANADGTSARQLTSNAALNAQPAVAPDGRFIVFVSNRSGVPHVWRMNSDGSNVQQLTDGAGEFYPTVSPDDQWVVLQKIAEPGFWKVPINGGTPERLMDKLAGQASFSPDGKLLACRYRETELSPFMLGLIDVATGATVKTIDIPPGNNLAWTPDGRAVIYVDTRAGVSNLWKQPIDGSAPTQLTSFKSDLIFQFDVNHDGKQAFSRGTVSNNVVLIADVAD